MKIQSIEKYHGFCGQNFFDIVQIGYFLTAF